MKESNKELDKFDVELGNLLRTWRDDEFHLTLRELDKKIKIPHQTIQAYEAGRRKVPTKVLKVFCDFFYKDINEVFASMTKYL